MSINVKFEEPMPLSLQLFDGATDKYIKVILKRPDGVALPESPVYLTNVGDGNYQDNAVLMPAYTHIVATFKVYDDAGYSVPSESHSDTEETFKLDIIDQDLIDQLIELKELLNELANQRVILPEPAAIKVKLVEDKITAILRDEGIEPKVSNEESISIKSEEETVGVTMQDEENVSVDKDC